MATIDFGGIVKEVCLAYTPEAEVGNYALIHVGFVISLMDEEEAQETLKLMKQTRYGEDVTIIGKVIGTGKPQVRLKTGIGSTRLVDMIPRIC